MSAQEMTVQEMEQAYVVHTYSRAPFVLSHGQGAYLYDTEGKRYLDLVSGIAVNALGYADPELVGAMTTQAARLIHAGLADAALVGGVDTLCGSVLFGFNSLGLVSTRPARPFDPARDGLSLGEAGGYALLERSEDCGEGLQLRGYGESSDAHHMSAPHPEGLGARMAMVDALQRAGIEPADVGHLNLHGTATPANDAVEAAVVAELFDAHLHASSTKGWTGHTLGAAGIVESVFALIALDDGLLPGTLNSQALDPACGPQLRLDNAHARISYAMNNSFGFGGNNCSLVFGKAAAR